MTTTSFLLQENSFFLLLENSGQIILSTGKSSIASSSIRDIQLTRQSDGIYDISLNDDGDIAQCTDLMTGILMSLLTDVRAAASEVPSPQLRRGWWGNLLNDDKDDEVGSKLWLLDQSRRTQDTLNKAENYITDSLKWLVTDGYVSKVSVSAEFADDGIKATVMFK